MDASPELRVRERIMFTRLIAAAAAFTLIAVVTVAGAAGPNPNRGKSLFKSTCKTCHVKAGAAKDLSPLTKTQAQWTRVFKNTEQITRMADRVKTKTGKALADADLTDMRAFLVAHAADSDQPETCGIK